MKANKSKIIDLMCEKNESGATCEIVRTLILAF